MRDRGRTIEQMRGYHMMETKGVGIPLGKMNELPRPIAGRICLDAYAYYKLAHAAKPYLIPLHRPLNISHECKTRDTAKIRYDGQVDGSHKYTGFETDEKPIGIRL